MAEDVRTGIQAHL